MRRLPYEAKKIVFDQVGYKPNPAQLAVHMDTTQTVFISGGVRGGKSYTVAAEALPHLLIPKQSPYIVPLLGPTYKEPREEFGYIAEWLLDLGIINMRRDVRLPMDGPAELTIPSGDTNTYAATLRIYSADEARSIRAFTAEAMIICEAGGISREAFDNAVGRVLSTDGFILASGTLERSERWYHNEIRNGQVPKPTVRSFILPSWENLAVFPGGRQDPKILRAEALMSPEAFRIRVGAEPIKMEGLVIKNASFDVVDEDLEFNPEYPVELAVDPGHAGAYAVEALQVIEGEIRVIDEVYVRLETTDEVVRRVAAKPWWANVEVSNPGVIDRAAKQHHADASVTERWFQYTSELDPPKPIEFDMSVETIPVDDGAEQLRLFIKSGRLRISPRCKGLLAEWELIGPPFEPFSPWHYKMNNDGELRGDKAVAGNDHASTALIYWLVQRYGYVTADDLLGYGNAEYLEMMRPKDETSSTYGASQAVFNYPTAQHVGVTD